MARNGIGFKLGGLSRFILLNFATPIAFYLTFHWVGAKPAIAFAITVALIQVVVQRLLAQPMSPFFLFSSSFTVVFGSVDLFLVTPRVFKIMPFAENALIGMVFLATVLVRKPIVLWFATALPQPFRPELGAEHRAYLRNLTIVWAVYLFAKAGFFLWLAYQVDLGRLIILRSVVGGGTLVLMIGGEILYRRWFPRRSPRRTKDGGRESPA